MFEYFMYIWITVGTIATFLAGIFIERIRNIRSLNLGPCDGSMIFGSEDGSVNINMNLPMEAIVKKKYIVLSTKVIEGSAKVENGNEEKDILHM